MSLPSIVAIAAERSIPDVAALSASEQEDILHEAMKRDLGPAIDLLHRKAHEAEDGNGSAEIIEDPNSPLGKMLTRICAGTALRGIAERRVTHGMELTFLNCCRVIVGTRPANLFLEQIKTQDGTVASADC